MTLLVVGCASALGYVFVWIYLASPVFGKLATLALVVIVFAQFIEARSREKVLVLIRLPDIWIPFALMLTVGLFLTAITYAGTEGMTVCPTEDYNFVNKRLAVSGSPDYLIQTYWVGGLSGGSPPWNWILDPAVSRSTVADRAPLLAGIVLIFNSMVSGKYSFVYFMAMTSAASLAWIPAIWGLARLAGLTLVRAAALVITHAFVYYFWFSTIYAWPKMLSGALLVGAIYLLFIDREKETEPVSLKSIILGSAFAGLSFVTHASVGMILLGMIPLLLILKNWLGAGRIIVAACVFLALVTPYMALKSFHEGPSSLTKYALTGNLIHTMPAAAYNAMTPLDAVRKVYSTLTWDEIIQNRLASFKYAFHTPCLMQCDGMSFKSSRSFELGPFTGSLKFFNLGWLVLVPLLLIGNTRLGLPQPWNQVRAVAGDCLYVAMSGLLVFLMISFSNVNNTATSGFMLLLVAATGTVLFSLPSKVIGLFSLLVVSNFLWFTSQVFREDNLVPVYPLLAIAMLALLGMTALIMVSARIDRGKAFF